MTFEISFFNIVYLWKFIKIIFSRSRALAYQLATVAHETMHCYGMDHCGWYTCCMNSWSDDIAEFALAVRHKKPKKKKSAAATKKGEAKARALGVSSNDDVGGGGSIFICAQKVFC